MVHTRDLRHEPWRYRLRAFVSKPANLLLVFFLTVLVLLSLLPMATMLSNMFTVHVGTEKKLLRLPVDSTTLWHFQKLFAGDDWSQVNFWQPLCNSLIVALGSAFWASRWAARSRGSSRGPTSNAKNSSRLSSSSPT